MEHNYSRHLPLEWSALLLFTGLAYIAVVIVGLFLLFFIRELLFPKKDDRDKLPGARPFMTPALRKAMAE